MAPLPFLYVILPNSSRRLVRAHVSGLGLVFSWRHFWSWRDLALFVGAGFQLVFVGVFSGSP